MKKGTILLFSTIILCLFSNFLFQPTVLADGTCGQGNSGQNVQICDFSQITLKTDIKVKDQSGAVQLGNFVRVGKDGNFSIEVVVTLVSPATLTFNKDQIGVPQDSTSPNWLITGVGAVSTPVANSAICTTKQVTDTLAMINCAEPPPFSQTQNPGTKSYKSGDVVLDRTFIFQSSDFDTLGIKQLNNGTDTTSGINEFYMYPALGINVPRDSFTQFLIDRGILNGGANYNSFTAAGKSVFVQLYPTQSQANAVTTPPPACSSGQTTGCVPGYGSNSNSGTNAVTNDTTGALLGLINKIIVTLLGFINELIYFLFFWLIAPLIQAMLSIHAYQDSFVNVIYPGWEIVRNVCNILFIIAIIAMGLGTLLRVDSYQYRNLLVKLVIAALLVNFSLVIAQVILAFADTIQAQFLPNNVDVIRSLARDLMVTNTRIATWNVNSASLGSFSYTVTFFFWVALAVGSFLVFAAIAAFLVIRVVALWVLLMLSPIAYVAGILPPTASLGQKWWSQFLKYAFFTPVIAFFLNMAAVISSSTQTRSVLQSVTSSSFSDSNMPALTDFVSKISSNIILLVFLVMAIKVAEEMGVAGGKILSEVGQKGMLSPFTYTGNKIKGKADEIKQKAATERLKLANEFTPKDEDKGTIKGFLKRAAYNTVSGGAVTKAKQKATADALHDQQHKAEAYGMAFKQQAKGEVMDAKTKYEQGHYNSEVKKSKDALENADVDTLAKAITDALQQQDAHKRAIDLEAATSVMLKEGMDGEVLKELRRTGVLTDADSQDLLNKADLHDPEGKRIAGIINRESRAKGKYQNLVKYTHGGTAKADIEMERQTALDNLKIEDLSNMHEALYTVKTPGLPTTGKPTNAFKSLAAAMKDEPTAKDLIKKMNKGKIAALKSTMATFAGTSVTDLGLTPGEFTIVQDNINKIT